MENQQTTSEYQTQYQTIPVIKKQVSIKDSSNSGNNPKIIYSPGFQNKSFNLPLRIYPAVNTGFTKFRVKAFTRRE